MEKFVIDTNFFVNLEIKGGFGKNPIEIVKNFVQLAKKAKENQKADFYMPPRVIDEFVSFFGQSELYQNIISVITIKSPDSHKISLNANIFYQLIDEVRGRAYRGLRIAEELVVKAGKTMVGQKNLTKIAFDKKIGEIIKNLRERYRQATRFNFIDSLADLDLIILSKEIDGYLISSDEGVVRWGRIFGVKELPPRLFRERLLFLLSKEKSLPASV